jgi:hypothetical protein
VLEWLSLWGGMAVKVSPAIDLHRLGPYPCEVEFISLHGELKEACLWFGEFKQGSRLATLLPAGLSLIPDKTVVLLVQAPGAFLYEPDPAILRAGLVGELGNLLQAWQIDQTLRLLSCDQGRATPYALFTRVEAVLPATLKPLRAALRQRAIGQLTLKMRGSAVEASDFARRLKLKGDRPATLLMTRVLGRSQALLIELLAPTGQAPPQLSGQAIWGS